MPLVVFVMIDGLRPEAVTPDYCPTFAGVMARGASTLRAASILPSITLPCHMTIFHSVPPERHGVTSNTWSPMARPVPGLVDVAHAAGKRCAFFYNWEPLRNVSQPGSLWVSHFRDSAYNRDGDVGIAAEAARLLSNDPPDFAFIYFGTVDTTGHAYGWMSNEYLTQAAFVDQSLRTVLEVLPGNSFILIHSDHGGHDRNHGTNSPEDMTIPWAIAGPGIRRGHTLTSAVSLLDTAPTLARLLRIAPHPEWEGRCVEEIFEA